MRAYKACVKKELLEQWRTGKFFIFTGIGIAMAVLAFATLGMMEAIKAFGIDMGGMASMFSPTFANGTMMFMSFMQAYFYIPVLIMIMAVVSKELKAKKWTLPISCGISPSAMIAAKFTVVVGSVLLASIISILFHFGLTMLLSNFFMTPQVSWATDIANMLRSYGYFLFFTLFITIVTISINAITKKGWPALAITIPMIILLPTIFSVIMVGGQDLASYTPFFFLNQISDATFLMGGPTFTQTTAQWVSSYFSTIIISGLLIFWAIKSTRIGKISS